MNKDEILKELELKGIIVKIVDEYLITEKYKELLLQVTPRLEIPLPLAKVKSQKYDELLNSKTNGGDWPVELLESTGRAKVVVLMDLCEVPTFCTDGNYRLRNVSTEVVNIIGNLLKSNEIDPGTFIEAVSLYYKYSKRPKGFKNFILDGEMLDVYNEHIEGKLLPGLSDRPIENRGEWG
jgi:hypothetical protein